MTSELPRPSQARDDELLAQATAAIGDVEHAFEAMLDQHHRDLTLPVLSLLNEAEQKARLALRMLRATS